MTDPFAYMDEPTDSESGDAPHNPDVWELRDRVTKLRAALPAGLPLLLTAIEAFDPSAHSNADEPDAAGRYQVRNAYVLRALAAALAAGFGGGVALDPNEPDFPVVYIDLPTGQVSWHITAYDGAWDGHTTAEKYQRCEAYRHTEGAAR